MSEDSKTVSPNHDREVRAWALEHAVALAERQNASVDSAFPRFDADAVVAMAEKFRAFLAVPGATGSGFVSMVDGTVRATLSPANALVLPSTINAATSPGVTSRDLIAEFRELVLFAQWLAAQDEAAKAKG